MVIANGGTKIVAKNKINCLYIDEDDIINSLIDKIEYLYKNESIRLKLGKKARNYALKNFNSWDDANRKDFKLIKNILKIK